MLSVIKSDWNCKIEAKVFSSCIHTAINYHGSKGIRQWPINWCTYPMMIHKITPYLSKLLVEMFELNEPINQNLLKHPKLLSQRIWKRYDKTLGTIVINSPLSSPSLASNAILYERIFYSNRVSVLLKNDWVAWLQLLLLYGRKHFVNLIILTSESVFTKQINGLHKNSNWLRPYLNKLQWIWGWAYFTKMLKL